MTTRQIGPFRRSPLITLWILCALGAGAVGSTVVFTQGRQGGGGGGGVAAWPPRFETPAVGEVEVLPVQGQICMIVGAGANITVQAGDAGVLVVGTGTAPMADKVLAAIRTISKKPLRYIVSTIEWPEYTGGNEKIAAAGEIIPFREATYIGCLVSGATSLGQPSVGDSRPVVGQHRVAISREFPCCIA